MVVSFDGNVAKMNHRIFIKLQQLFELKLMQKELSTNVSFNYSVFHGFFLIKINCSNNIVNFVEPMLEFWMSGMSI
jgi:hypothetical protein